MLHVVLSYMVTSSKTNLEKKTNLVVWYAVCLGHLLHIFTNTVDLFKHRGNSVDPYQNAPIGAV